jgi:hypothetical protein
MKDGNDDAVDSTTTDSANHGSVKDLSSIVDGISLDCHQTELQSTSFTVNT